MCLINTYTLNITFNRRIDSLYRAYRDSVQIKKEGKMISREKIISAAVTVFSERGRHGARVEEIARCGHINKAMIYYIYSSKDELYFEVIKFIHEKLIETLAPVAEKLSQVNSSYNDELNHFLSSYTQFFNEYPDYRNILIDAMSNGPEETLKVIKYINETYKDKNIAVFMKDFIDRGKSARYFRDIDTEQIMISIYGMLILNSLPDFFLGRTGLKTDDNSRNIDTSNINIIDVLLNGIVEGKSRNEKIQDLTI